MVSEHRIKLILQIYDVPITVQALINETLRWGVPVPLSKLFDDSILVFPHGSL